MEDQDQTQSASRLCRQGCGYFGHAVFDGFCSQCHKRLQDAKNPSEPRTASCELSVVLQLMPPSLSFTQRLAFFAALEIVPKSQGSTGRSSPELPPHKSPDDCPKVEISTVAVAEDPPTAGNFEVILNFLKFEINKL